jgi:hypothetical protein
MAMHRGESAWWAAAAVAVAGAASIGAQVSRPVAHVDAPLLRIACDELPIRTPTQLEAQDDERDRPYHALVRVWSFPSRRPLDVPLENLRLLGAETSARVAPAEYAFTSITVGYTNVALLDAAAGPRPPGPGRRTLAGRNPLVLARHAWTVCDLFVVEEERLDETTTFRGLVVDRTDSSPLAGVAIACGARTIETDAEGRFTFPEQVPWRDLLSKTLVKKDGYRLFVMNPVVLSTPWVDRILTDGEAVFALSPENEEKASGLLPLLMR